MLTEYDPTPQYNAATFADYQRDAARTINPYQTQRDNIANFALGLAGEAGEVAEPIKKHLYHARSLDVVELSKELGDVLWYVAALCSVFNLDMGTIARENIAKLRARWPGKFGEPAPVDPATGAGAVRPWHDTAGV